MPKLSAPDDVTEVSLSMPDGPVVVKGPEADVDDETARELVALGWTEKKTGTAAKKKPTS